MHIWKVVIQRSDGQILELEKEYKWNPDKDFITPESIAKTAAAEQFVLQGERTHSFTGISAELVR